MKDKPSVKDLAVDLVSLVGEGLFGDTLLDRLYNRPTLNGGETTAIEQDCMRCEETFTETAHNDYCPKCRRNMNRTDMR